MQPDHRIPGHASVAPHPAAGPSRAIAWVARDAWRSFRGRMVRVVALNVAAVLLAGAAFTGLYLLARSLDSGEGFALGPLAFHPGASVGAVLAAAGALTVLGAASGGAVYLTEWLAAGIGLDYGERLLERIVVLAGDPGLKGSAAFAEPPGRSGLQRLASGAPRVSALVVRHMVKTVLPAATLLAAVPVLVLREPVLSLLLLPAAVLYTVPLYRVSRGVAAADVAYRESSGAAKQRIAELLDRLEQRGLAEGSREAEIRGVVSGPEHRASGRHYFERRLAPDRAQLLNTVFFLAVVFVAFAYFAVRDQGAAPAWADLLLYIVALRFALGGLRGVAGAVVVMGRFAPRLERVVAFVEGAEALGARRAGVRGEPLRDGLTLRWTPNGGQTGDASTLTVPPGGFLWVVGAGDGAFGVEAAALTVGAAADPPLDPLSDDTPRVAVLEARRLRETDGDSIRARLAGDGSVPVLVCAPSASFCFRPMYSESEDHCAGGIVLRGSRIVAGGDLEWLRRYASTAPDEAVDAERGGHGGAHDLDDDED